MFFLFLFFYSFFLEKIFSQIYISGNFYSESQVIESKKSEKISEKFRTNNYFNLYSTYKNFSFGIRYEAYLNALLGYDNKLNGQGITYKMINYKNDKLELTVGNFYEQFGYGLTLRSYEEKLLGIDNAFEGIKLKSNLLENNIMLKALVGKQRDFFSLGEGIVKGIDCELNPITIFKKNSFNNLIVGVSFVSKYQKDKDPFLKLPENVGIIGTRINFYNDIINSYIEYSYKINDPSADNNYIYKDGYALIFSNSLTKENFGFLFNFKYVDNMSFRSDLNAKENRLFINFIPFFVKNYTYESFTIYPYKSFYINEGGGSIDFYYNFKKGTFIGGKYGTNIYLQYNRYHDIKKIYPSDTNKLFVPGTYGYKSNFLSLSDSLFLQSFILEINKKVSNTFKFNFVYQYSQYNYDAIVEPISIGYLYINSFAFDANFKISEKVNFAYINENLLSKKHLKNWLINTFEIYLFHKFSLSLRYLFNYDNYPNLFSILNKYYLFSFTLLEGNTKISISYGKIKEGVKCISGTCKYFPLTKGFILQFFTNF